MNPVVAIAVDTAEKVSHEGIIENEYDIIKCCHPECAGNKCKEVTETFISEEKNVFPEPINSKKVNFASHDVTHEDKVDNIETLYSDEKGCSNESVEKQSFPHTPYHRNSGVLRKTIAIPHMQVPDYAYAHDSPELRFQRQSSVMETTESRKHEKTDLQNLNSRLATFIEKVRYLEVYNKALIDEIEKLRNAKANNGSKLHEIYEKELNNFRKTLDEAQGQLTSADVTILGLEDQVKALSLTINDNTVILEDLKNKNDGLMMEVGNYQGKVTRLGDRCKKYENELTSNSDLIQHLRDADISSKTDLDAETIKHLDAENRARNIENQLAFVTATNEQEIIELKGLLNERRGDTEVKEYWQGELSKAVGDIQADYDERLRYLTNDMEQKLVLQVQTIRESAVMSESSTSLKEELSRQKIKVCGQGSQIVDLQSENARLRTSVNALTQHVNDANKDVDAEKTRMQEEIKRLQNELDVVMYELQTLMNAKMSMQMEIATYKKLLEYEETRVEEPSLKMAVLEKPVFLQHELSEQRHAIGEVTFNEAPADGRYVSIKNRTRDTKTKPLLLKGWSICRINSVGKSTTYTFGDVKIASLETIKIWGKGQSVSKIPFLKDGLVADFNTWGTGNSDIYLYNEKKQEKASIKLVIR